MIDSLNIYFVVDRARTGAYIDDIYEFNLNISCLYKGNSQKYLSDYAPYLIEITNQPIALEWLLDESYKDHWGIFIFTKLNFDDIYKHLRKFLIVATEDNQEYYFRYYDPRVIKMFLPTCDNEQLRIFFGEIEFFAVESDNPNEFWKYYLKNEKLFYEKINFTELFEYNKIHIEDNINKTIIINNELDELIV